MSRRKKVYELGQDHKLRELLMRLAQTMNTPEKVDFARLILRDTERPLKHSFIDAYPSDTPTRLIVRVALLEVEGAISNSSWKDKTLPLTIQMRYAIEQFITPLGDHTSAITAGEVAKWYCSDWTPNITHGMSLTETTVSHATHASLVKLENAIREAVENESEVA